MAGAGIVIESPALAAAIRRNGSQVAAAFRLLTRLPLPGASNDAAAVGAGAFGVVGATVGLASAT